VCVCVCVCLVLVDVMTADSNKLLLEVTRVCGNLSRYPVVREILMENKGTCTYGHDTRVHVLCRHGGSN